MSTRNEDGGAGLRAASVGVARTVDGGTRTVQLDDAPGGGAAP